jgi:hypothetical protein
MGDRRLMRSRWAAIGAAVAVSLAGGGAFYANAATSAPSSVVTIDPVRVLDTRTDVGLPGPFVSPVSQKLQVAGGAVPAGATGVLMNVTVVAPAAAGFLSVRPGDASGAPTTSSMNFPAGATVANSVQVALPTSGGNAGKIDITYDALGVRGPSTEVLADVVGYLLPSASGPAGPAGLAGPVGPPGPVNLRWAKVAVGADPFLWSKSGATAVTRMGDGHYSVRFEVPVAGCGWTATVNDNNFGGAVPGYITVEMGDVATDLWVKTWATTSTASPTPADLSPGHNDGFTVMAVCP